MAASADLIMADDVDYYAPADDDGTEAVIKPAPAPASAEIWTDYQPPPVQTAQQQETWSDYQPSAEEWKDYTEPESAMGAFTRELVHGVGPSAAAAAGGVLTGSAIGAAIPLPGTTLVGGLIGGGIAAYGAEAVQDTAAKAMGFDDDAVRAANVK